MENKKADIWPFSGRENVVPESESYKRIPTIGRDETSPDGYLTPSDLAAAVNVALTLGMPLLLTGEPGCGKSQLARRIAWELDFPKHAKGDKYPEPLKFTVKSTTEARDLFYVYDTVGRFHAAQFAKERNDNQDEESITNGQNSEGPSSADRPENFIEYQALGRAILLSKGRNQIPAGVVNDAVKEKYYPKEKIKSVVLIDEIDKAPRDVPNDILTEIDELRFTVKELQGLANNEIKLEEEDKQYRPVIIITSNGERDLPDAFLRRCVYYHVPFPSFKSDIEKESTTNQSSNSVTEVTVESIVESRLGDRFEDKPLLLDQSISLFKSLRKESEGDLPGQDKPGRAPSMAELLKWLYCVEKVWFRDSADERPDLLMLSDHEIIETARVSLLKTKADQDAGEKIIQEWLNKQRNTKR
ncbi:MAG: MoxR family ATPase [Pseudomonadota bacterium]